ncbi:hypothetical protein [Sulfobacillus harzensis]|uniref:Uncharacterized protein n=1 Tax=Sulfobacillus harzensis TaxID=2729629 RepID=A0A7Y0Q405_9FIRM|nr:hypothetical protein [Sulfobacillus harzensis]NMP23915.1 hypothetical protein [Sulfobacillus harzensis]
MRIWGLGILAIGALVAIVEGWSHLWPLLHQARGLALTGWILGLVGLALLVGRRKRGAKFRYALGLTLAAVGMALLAVPHDGQGLLTGLRLGYGGALLAVLPHSFRAYRSLASQGVSPEASRPKLGEEALQ